MVLFPHESASAIGLSKWTRATIEAPSRSGRSARSERIRTYNFPQGRVTDHRIGLTLYKLDQVIQGDLAELVEALTAADQAAKLAEMEP